MLNIPAAVRNLLSIRPSSSPHPVRFDKTLDNDASPTSGTGFALFEAISPAQAVLKLCKATEFRGF